MYIVQRALAFTAAPRRSALTTLDQLQFQLKALCRDAVVCLLLAIRQAARNQTRRVSASGEPQLTPTSTAFLAICKPVAFGFGVMDFIGYVKLAHCANLELHFALRRLLRRYILASITPPSAEHERCAPQSAYISAWTISCKLDA